MFSVSDRCQDVSSFEFIVFILIHGDRTIPSVILGDSRDLTGEVPCWWSRCRLCRSCDFVHTVLSFAFAFAFAFLAFVVGCAALACVPRTSNLWPCGQHVRTRSNSSSDPSVLLFPLLFAFAFLRQGIDLHVIWSSPVVRVSLSHLRGTVRCVCRN